MSNFSSVYKAIIHDLGDPDGRGRAKLLVPAVLGRGPSGWAPPLEPGFDARAGDLAWVWFENGDLNRPVWVPGQGVARLDKRVTTAEADVIALQSGKSPTGHLHDDRYFTETESDARFVQHIEPGTVGSPDAPRRVTGLVNWSDTLANAGDLVIETNLTFTGVMADLHITGFNAVAGMESIDLRLGFHAASTPSFLKTGAKNNGSAPFSQVRLMRRTADNKVVIVLSSGSSSTFWHQPKISVDGVFGYVTPTDDMLQGWTVTRTTNLAAFTPMVTVVVAEDASKNHTHAPTSSIGVYPIPAASHSPNDSTWRTIYIKENIPWPSNAPLALVHWSNESWASANAAGHYQFHLGNTTTGWTLLAPHDVHNNTYASVGLGTSFTIMAQASLHKRSDGMFAMAINVSTDSASGSWMYMGNGNLDVSFLTPGAVL